MEISVFLPVEKLWQWKQCKKMLYIFADWLCLVVCIEGVWQIFVEREENSYLHKPTQQNTLWQVQTNLFSNRFLIS